MNTLNLYSSRCTLFLVFLLLTWNLFAQNTEYDLNSTTQEKSTFETSTRINSNNFAFPEGKLKGLIMSFDDGPEHDRVLLEKLNQVDIVGTFHFNSGRLGKQAEWLTSELGYEVYFVTEEEVSSIYDGHEISGHTSFHTALNNLNDSIIKVEVLSDFQKLNRLIKKTNHHAVQGLAYPFGAYDNHTLEVLESLDVKYARTVKATHHFELPTASFLELHPTCHVFDGPKFATEFVNNEAKEMQLLHIWGHSYEFHNNWELADSICDVLGNNKDIWYAQTIAMVDYLNAIKGLTYANDKVYNPSKEISVWIKDKTGAFVALKPGASMSVDFQSSFAKISQHDRLYPPKSSLIKYHNDWTKNNYKKRISEFKKAPLNFGEIVFVGNSLTEQGGDWSEKTGITTARNRGIAGDVTDGVLRRLDEITYFKPKTIFLLIGINDLFNLYYQKEIPSPEYVGNNIIKITEAIHVASPDTEIYVQTLLPTSEDYMIDLINTVNNIINKHEKDSDYQLINLFDLFVDANGLMKPNLTNDGTHLNEAGYKVWVDKINSTLSKTD